MSITLSRPMIGGLALLLALISGILLSHAGKPYNTGIFTVHKLVAIAAIILIGVSIYNLSKIVDVHALYLIVFAVTGLAFLGLIVSGALLSLVTGDILTLDQGALRIVLRIHQIMPVLAMVFSSISLYLLINNQS